MGPSRHNLLIYCIFYEDFPRAQIREISPLIREQSAGIREDSRRPRGGPLPTTNYIGTGSLDASR